MVDHFHILAPFYDRLMGPPDAAHLAGLLKLPIALAEKIAGMQSRFLRPQDIRDKMRHCGLKSYIETGRRFAAWIVGDKL